VDCHQNPVSGGSSQFTEIRAGHLDEDGHFVAATVPINDGASTIANRSIINDRALIPRAQEHLPDMEDIRALRAALNTLGDGFVEAIDDNTLRNIAQRQIELTAGRIHGEAVEVPVWRRQDNRASDALAGKISTAVAFIHGDVYRMKWA
jgi:hypothetical protein